MLNLKHISLNDSKKSLILQRQGIINHDEKEKGLCTILYHAKNVVYHFGEKEPTVATATHR